MNLNFCYCGKEREMKKLVSVCVFLLALVTGVFAMAQEPVYGVLFISKKEYTLEKGKFKATVPQVQAVSFIDGRTPVNECSGRRRRSINSFVLMWTKRIKTIRKRESRAHGSIR